MTKKEKEEIEIISEFEAHFIKQRLDPNNQEEIEYIKKTATDVLRLEIQELGYKLKGEEKDGDAVFELEFVNDPNIEGLGCKIYDSNKIEIILNKFIKILSSADVEERQNRCRLLFKTIFHEVHHHIQEIISKLNISSKIASLFSKEFILENQFKDWYDEEYYNIATEAIADFYARSQYIDLMKPENPKLYYDRNMDFYFLKIRNYRRKC